jgi:hypothetical protein
MKYLKYFESLDELKPSDIVEIEPMSCVLKKCEAEIVARNIIVILYRTGDKFRNLSWEEYKEERLKNKNFWEGEKKWFDLVIDYCTDSKKVKAFSKYWNVKSKAEIASEKFNL